MDDKKIVEELQNLNKTIKDLFIFLLCKEGYTKEQIRGIFGKIDNNKVTKIGVGIKGKKK
ncbi:MAG: hypothetical protein WC878_04875 [Candidatus Paceibacterota bacterium]|jgi:hypothetical protein